MIDADLRNGNQSPWLSEEAHKSLLIVMDLSDTLCVVSMNEGVSSIASPDAWNHASKRLGTMLG